MADDAGAAPNAACPRCGAAFHCGASESGCACAQLPLDAETRAALARRYAGCLCIVCLRAVQAGARRDGQQPLGQALHGALRRRRTRA